MTTAFIDEFKANSIANLNENTPRIIQCMNELTESEIWQKPNGSLNSMGNLVLHLCGNITQYIISSLGGKPDSRERDSEFATTGGYNREQLIEKLVATLEEAVATINNAEEATLLKIHSVQGFQLSGIGIINHVANHYSYHTGQFAFWVKLLREKDLAFYGGFDLNKKNEGLEPSTSKEKDQAKQ